MLERKIQLTLLPQQSQVSEGQRESLKIPSQTFDVLAGNTDTGDKGTMDMLQINMSNDILSDKQDLSQLIREHVLPMIEVTR